MLAPKKKRRVPVRDMVLVSCPRCHTQLYFPVGAPITRFCAC